MGNPEQYIENNREAVPEEAAEAMRQYIEDAEANSSTVYDNLSRIKKLYDRGFVPEDFSLEDPSIKGLDKIFDAIDDAEDISEGTKFSYRKALKGFYRDYKKNSISKMERIKQIQENNLPVPDMHSVKDCGPHYHKVVWFSAKNGSGTSSVKVEPWMILSPEEVNSVLNRAQGSRERAFFSIGYSCAATSGEIIQLYVHDVDLEDESIYIRGNKQHRSQTMELLNEALTAVREYLSWHPAVKDPYKTDNVRDENGKPVPLWIKKRAPSCKHCEQPKTYHRKEDKDTCEKYEPKPWEKVGTRPFFKTWRRAVKKSDVTRLEEKDGKTITEKDLKMKHLRKSMLTRFAAEIETGVKEEKLREFARWMPGQGAPGHYISLSESISRDLVKKSFKGKDVEEQEPVTCSVCNTRNPPGSIRCQKCHRSLDAPSSAQQDKLRELADKLGAVDPEKLQKAIDQVESQSHTERLEARIAKLEQQNNS